MEADTEDEVVCLDPGHHGLHLPLPPSRHLVVCPAQVSPARELPVEILVINIMPSPGLTPVRVDGGNKVDVSRVHKRPDFLISVIRIAKVPKDAMDDRSQIQLIKNFSPCKTNEEFPSDLLIAVYIGHELDTGHEEGRAVSHISCYPHPPDLPTLCALTNTVPGDRRCQSMQEDVRRCQKSMSGRNLSMMAGWVFTRSPRVSTMSS